jgi:hypothetical protein
MSMMDPYVTLKLVKQHRKEAERAAADYRLWRTAVGPRPGLAARVKQRLALVAGGWLSSLSSWLQESGAGGEPSLDGRMHASHGRS